MKLEEAMNNVSEAIQDELKLSTKPVSLDKVQNPQSHEARRSQEKARSMLLIQIRDGVHSDLIEESIANLVREAKKEGYNEGWSDGHDEGYDEGYEDGQNE